MLIKTQYGHLLEAVLLSIGDRLSRPGYQLIKARKQFRARQPFGATVIIVNTIVHPGLNFDITGQVAVRFDRVQELAEMHSPTSAAEKALTFTLGSEFGNLIDGKQKRWTITCKDDVHTTAISFCKTLDEIGFPYIDKYSNPQNALQALSGNEQENWSHMPSHGSRAQRAVALAYILNQPQLAKEIANRNREFLKARNDFGLLQFEKTAQSILGLI